MKIWCLKCNGVTEYSSSKPSFCSKCGKPFVDSNASVTIAKPTVQPVARQEQRTHPGKLNRRYVEEEEEYFEHPEDATSVPQIDKLDFNLTVSNLRPNRESGRDVLNSGSESEAREVLSRRPIKAEKVTKAKSKQIQQESRQRIQEDFKSQLSTRRGKDSTEIGG